MSKAEAKVRAHSAVIEVLDERKLDGGIWAHLVPHRCHHGMRSGTRCTLGGCVHSVHESTWTAVVNGLREVGPCDCGDCNG
jgi:hypothetical protein